MRKAKRKLPLGRPPTTGKGQQIVVRMHPPMLKRLDRWIARREMSRPEAVRQLIDCVLRARESATT